MDEPTTFRGITIRTSEDVPPGEIWGGYPGPLRMETTPDGARRIVQTFVRHVRIVDVGEQPPAPGDLLERDRKKGR